MSRHACAIARCEEQIPVTQYLCYRHWHMAPSQLQSRLNRAWAKRKSASSREALTAAVAEHIAAKDAIKAAVEARIGGGPVGIRRAYTPPED